MSEEDIDNFEQGLLLDVQYDRKFSKGKQFFLQIGTDDHLVFEYKRKKPSYSLDRCVYKNKEYVR